MIFIKLWGRNWGEGGSQKQRDWKINGKSEECEVKGKWKTWIFKRKSGGVKNILLIAFESFIKLGMFAALLFLVDARYLYFIYITTRKVLLSWKSFLLSFPPSFFFHRDQMIGWKTPHKSQLSSWHTTSWFFSPLSSPSRCSLSLCYSKTTFSSHAMGKLKQKVEKSNFRLISSHENGECIRQNGVVDMEMQAE